MVTIHTCDLEKVMDDDSKSNNYEIANSLKARYKKLFTILKDSTLLQVWHLKLVKSFFFIIVKQYFTETTERQGFASWRLWEGKESGSQEAGGTGSRAHKF